MTPKAKLTSTISFVKNYWLLISFLLSCWSGLAFANNWDATGLSASVTSNAPYTASVSWTNPTHPSFSEVKVYRNGSLIATTVSTSLTDGGLQAGTTYTYKVISCLIAQGCEADGPSVSVTTGGGASTPITPATPVVTDTSMYLVNNLTVSASSPTSVSVSWLPPISSTGLNGYRIFRNGSFLIDTTAFLFMDSGVQASNKYFYSVAACYNGTGCQSASAPVYIDTPTVVIAKNVTNLIASKATDTSITLGWTTPNDVTNQTEYKIFKSGVLVGTTKNSSFTDTGLSPVTTYSYQVLRCTVGLSCLSDGPRLTASTTKIPPKPPTALTAQVFGVTVDLSWSASVDASTVSEYKIYRDGVLVGSSKTTSYSDPKLKENTAYNYNVIACFSDGICDSNCSQVTAITDMPAVTVSLPSSTLSQATTISQQSIEMSAKATGEISNLTLMVKVKIPVTKPSSVFVAFVFSGNVFFLDGKGNWTQYSPISGGVEYQFIKDTPIEIEIPIVKNSDVSSIKGGQVVVGFSSTGLTVQERFNNLISNTSYNVVYTVGP